MILSFPPTAMTVIVNGQSVTVDSPSTVRQMDERMGLGKAACAVEVNRKVVPRRQHESQQLNDGDQVEIVTLVGGG